MTTDAETGQPRRGSSQRAQQKQRTRLKLIEATREVVTAHGLSGTTMGKVARQAGLSQGIVNFHFESKEQLLCHTLESLTKEYQAAWESALAAADDHPAAQLEAMVRALLRPGIADRTRVACWFAFWGDAYGRGLYRKIGSQVDKKTHMVIENLCAELAGKDDSDAHPGEVAENLVAMVSGHWLMKLLRPAEMNLKRATRCCLIYLRGVFPDQFADVE